MPWIDARYPTCHEPCAACARFRMTEAPWGRCGDYTSAQHMGNGNMCPHFQAREEVWETVQLDLFGEVPL